MRMFENNMKQKEFVADNEVYCYSYKLLSFRDIEDYKTLGFIPFICSCGSVHLIDKKHCKNFMSFTAYDGKPVLQLDVVCLDCGNLNSIANFTGNLWLVDKKLKSTCLVHKYDYKFSNNNTIVVGGQYEKIDFMDKETTINIQVMASHGFKPIDIESNMPVTKFDHSTGKFFVQDKIAKVNIGSFKKLDPELVAVIIYLIYIMKEMCPKHGTYIDLDQCAKCNEHYQCDNYYANSGIAITETIPTYLKFIHNQLSDINQKL